MYFCTTLAFILAFWNSVFVGAAPVPLHAVSVREQGQSVYDGGGQIPLVTPSWITAPPPPPPSPLAFEPKPTTSPPETFMLPKWVTAPYPKSLQDKDRYVFQTTLQGLTLARKHSAMGNNNAGVYSVASYDSSFSHLFPSSIARDIAPERLLVKILKDLDDDMIAEVKALKIVDQFVASGMLRLPVEKSNEVGRKRKGRTVKDVRDSSEQPSYELKPVIVMLKMPGAPLTSTPEYVSAEDPQTRRRMMGDTLGMMCDRVGRLALEHRFVHRDNIIGNILVIVNGTEIVDVNIIDWGGKYLSSIQDNVTWDDLMAWCHHRWTVSVWERGL